MFMLMDDVGRFSWHFGKKLLASSAESEQPVERKTPAGTVHTPAAE
jgi:hypothetical protein